MKSGKWYFEVRILTTGSIQIGWCTTNYEPKVNPNWKKDEKRTNKTQANTLNGDLNGNELIWIEFEVGIGIEI